MRRRYLLRLAGMGALATCFSYQRPAFAESVAVPEVLQTKLLAKVAKYDRNLPKRAGAKLNIVILRKTADSASKRTAGILSATLSKIPNIAGLPSEVRILEFSSARAVADYCQSQQTAIVYLTPGLGDQVKALAAALSGVSVLTVSAVASHVEQGAVLGFDLIEGKPKIVIHLQQAKLQQVSFLPALLRLAKIVAR